MEISEKAVSDGVILRVQDPRIDAAGAIGFKDSVRRLASGHAGRIVLDLANVDFIDSSGLGAVVSIMKELGGKRLELAGLHGAVAKVFSLTHMDSVFVIHASADAAFGEVRAAE